MVQFDIKTAFLYAKLDKPIYMKQPEGFVVTGKENFCLQTQQITVWPQASTSTVV
jgi:hypothetical protein